METCRRVTNYITIKKVSIRGCLITKLDDRATGCVGECKSDITSGQLYRSFLREQVMQNNFQLSTYKSERSVLVFESRTAYFRGFPQYFQADTGHDVPLPSSQEVTS